MLKLVFVLVVALVSVKVSADPSIVLCMDLCEDFHALRRECQREKNCFYTASYPHVYRRSCLDECWDLTSPCELSCKRHLGRIRPICSSKCHDYSCLQDCLRKEFSPLKPQLPEMF